MGLETQLDNGVKPSETGAGLASLRLLLPPSLFKVWRQISTENSTYV
jgi:hypothetical protein